MDTHTHGHTAGIIWGQVPGKFGRPAALPPPFVRPRLALCWPPGGSPGAPPLSPAPSPAGGDRGRGGGAAPGIVRSPKGCPPPSRQLWGSFGALRSRPGAGEEWIPSGSPPDPLWILQELRVPPLGPSSRCFSGRAFVLRKRCIDPFLYIF